MKFAAFVFAFSLSVSAHAHKVIGISGGDTLTLLVDKQPLKIRLANIDAPEAEQPFGRQSKESLAELCWGKDATYEAQDIVRHGHTVAVVTCGGVETSRAQIERGMAWVEDKYNRDFTLPALQAMARRDRIGLWSDENPVPPWEFRRPQIKRASAVPPADRTDDAICFIDRRGEYRIVAGAKRYGC
jgi:micrococcal nuclease